MEQEEEVEIEMDEEEIVAMDEFKKADDQIEGRLDGVLDGIGRIQNHVKKINKANDEVRERV